MKPAHIAQATGHMPMLVSSTLTADHVQYDRGHRHAQGGGSRKSQRARHEGEDHAGQAVAQR